MNVPEKASSREAGVNKRWYHGISVLLHGAKGRFYFLQLIVPRILGVFG